MSAIVKVLVFAAVSLIAIRIPAVRSYLDANVPRLRPVLRKLAPTSAERPIEEAKHGIKNFARRFRRDLETSP